MRWTGPIAKFMRDPTPEIDLEGSLSCGKTTACLWKEFNALQEMPGIHSYIGRYGDGETQTKIKPAFEAVCQKAGCIPRWSAQELAYDFPNGSKCYAYGLKSPDALSRYSKMRGMGVSRIYNDQTEELPEDFSLELRLRLRQEGYPHQLTFSPNPPNVTHWLAQQFPEDNSIPGRAYYAVSIFDNQHNLPKELLDAALLAYPAEHAKHRSVILGKRGMNVTGEPVYKGAFIRAIHERRIDFSRELALEESIDFGKHHPCVVWRQQTPYGQTVYLGGILGQNLYLDDFLPMVLRYRADWFPHPIEVRTCCDPAGATDNSQGTRQNGVTTLKAFGFNPQWQANSNAPDVRLTMIERQAGMMRKRTPMGEAFGVSVDRWLTISDKSIVPDKFLADGFEAGYVWDEHMVSVGNKQVRKAKKDGWFEHGMNASEYAELNFGGHARKPKAEPVNVAPYRPRAVWG